MNINLHIEQLILKEVDLPRHQRSQLQAAVTAELHRLLVENGVPASFQKGGAIPRLPVNLAIASGARPVQIGQQIAQSVYGALTSYSATAMSTQAQAPASPSTDA